MRLIDADKLVDMLYDSEYTTLCPLDEVCGVIDACPTAEFAPVQNGELRDAAAQVTKLAAEAAVERDWISVEDRLPEVWRNDETAELVNYMIYSPDFGVDIGNYHATAKKWLCMALPCTVTHWMPLPEPPEEVEE